MVDSMSLTVPGITTSEATKLEDLETCCSYARILSFKLNPLRFPGLSSLLVPKMFGLCCSRNCKLFGKLQKLLDPKL